MLIYRLLRSTRHHLLCTTMCCLLAVAPDAMAGFDPDAGKEEVAPIIGTQSLTRNRTVPAPLMLIQRTATPEKQAAFIPTIEKAEAPQPLYPLRGTIPVAVKAEAKVEEVAPEPIIGSPPTTILPSGETLEQEMEIAAASIAPASNPPTDPSVVTQPKTEGINDSVITESLALTNTPPQEIQIASYIAPPPPLPDIAPLNNIASPTSPSTPTSTAAPNINNSANSTLDNATTVAPPPPVLGSTTITPTLKTGQSASLSNETKEILGRIPNHIGAPPPAAAPTRTTLSRVSPEVSSLIPALEKQVEYEQAGLKISMHRQGFDSNIELNRAYEALIAGDSEIATDIYQNIIAAEPRNQDALFGLAATYHRAGELAKARPLYGALLRVNPNHREGLNNFLVLVSDEAPEEALFELQKLATRNPEFSPIRAQMALLLEKLGQHELARQEILKAIRITPENLVYKYNLAVMMDRQGHYADASALYGLLVDAALRGESIPAPLEEIQKRLTYINTASLDTRGG